MSRPPFWPTYERENVRSINPLTPTEARVTVQITPSSKYALFIFERINYARKSLESTREPSGTPENVESETAPIYDRIGRFKISKISVSSLNLDV